LTRIQKLPSTAKLAGGIEFQPGKGSSCKNWSRKKCSQASTSKGCSSMPPTGYSHIPIQPIYQNCFPKMQVLSRMNCKALAV